MTTTWTWIAEELVIWAHPDGRREPGRIAVGLPVQVDDLEAECWVALDGFHHNPQPMIGTSTLQALLIAVRFLGWRVHDFIAKGGRMLDPEGNAITVEAMFGHLLQSAKVAPDDREPAPE